MERKRRSLIENTDSTPMTGGKADGIKPEKPKRAISSTFTSGTRHGAAAFNDSKSTERPKARKIVNDSEDESEPSWNFLDPVETETRLRPKITPPTWSRRIPSDHQGQDKGRPKPKPKYKKPALFETSSIAKSGDPVNAMKRSTLAQQTHKRSHKSSDSDEPLAAKRSKAPLPSPSQTRTSSVAASRTGNPTIIPLDSSEERESPQGHDAFMKKKAKASHKVDASIAAIKAEPLSADAVAKTVFRVSADNIPEKGPIHVPFKHSPTSDDLFTVLLRERKIRGELIVKISDVTATCTWGEKKKFGIRKGKLADWAAFYKYLRKAWESDSNDFEDGCEVDMMIHVDK